MSTAEGTAAGSQTVVQTVVQTEEEAEQPSTASVALKKPKSKGIKWDESTAIDNEHMGKKSSKICCIYHKPREYDESDSEDDCQNHKNAYDRQSGSSNKKCTWVYYFEFLIFGQ